ncbi:Sec-independent protein translocase protein TatB [Microvirga arabica]|uniref:Sec-independent protein translocase protein TatB n=1 Tax=Microvirga arabica TaxID=1128671 RepID=A0ABV6YD00_9HYPH|nr:Sec-independent protein translocase protein TatB [Microvirga arabica]MBM1173107.1 twin-arginine translocase subunit TatB [Microvirga arabica]
MLDMSWGEIMTIGAVALIVIGPKDLPKALRTVGQMTSKLRRMASEFQGQFNEAMREAELDEVKKQLQSVNEAVPSLNTSFNPIQTIRDELKTSIEAPVATAEKAPEPESSPEPAQVEVQVPSDASVQAAVEGRAPAPADPLVDLPLPQSVDPATEIAESLRREAEYEAQQAALAQQFAEKPDAKVG